MTLVEPTDKQDGVMGQSSNHPGALAIDQCIENLVDTQRLLEVSLAGLRFAERSVENHDLLVEYGLRRGTIEALGAEQKKQRTLALERAQFAAAEAADGHFRLCCQFLTSVWTSLEVMVEDAAKASIEYQPERLADPVFATATLALKKLTSDDERPILLRLVDLAYESVEKGNGAGVTFLESFLRLAGCDGSVDAATGSALYELQGIRNVVVHRRGVADERFVAQCPHLGATAGEQLPLTVDGAHRYWLAALRYSFVVCNRLIELEGGETLPLPPLENDPT